MRTMRKRILIIFPSIVLLVCLAGALLAFLPPVQERLSWRLENLRARIQRMINPPEQVVFVPEGQDDMQAVQTIAQNTLAALIPSATPSPAAATQAGENPVSTPAPSATATQTFTPTPTLTPIPGTVILDGIRHEYQQFNNCGPSNLSMALSYYGWQGDQRDTRSFLRPSLDVDDKNVMPSEMVAYVEQFTQGLGALTRVAGDLDTLKRLIAAGFPVIIEAGHHPADDYWMGHFLVVNGYDDERQRFITQDSLILPDLPLPYEEIGEHWWRDFNYVYIVIYPLEREADVLAILGAHSDPTYNFQFAAQRAQEETQNLTGRDLYFAWFNLGASLVELEDYQGAAAAFDQAFAVYQRIPENERPYRMMWYRVDPYPAYYYSGRYDDVIELANTTFTWVSQPVLEESYFWRGMAYEATGVMNQAISDYQKAAALNPYYAPPHDALQRLGAPLP